MMALLCWLPIAVWLLIRLEPNYRRVVVSEFFEQRFNPKQQEHLLAQSNDSHRFKPVHPRSGNVL